MCVHTHNISIQSELSNFGTRIVRITENCPIPQSILSLSMYALCMTLVISLYRIQQHAMPCAVVSFPRLHMYSCLCTVHTCVCVWMCTRCLKQPIHRKTIQKIQPTKKKWSQIIMMAAVSRHVNISIGYSFCATKIARVRALCVSINGKFNWINCAASCIE